MRYWAGHGNQFEEDVMDGCGMQRASGITALARKSLTSALFTVAVMTCLMVSAQEKALYSFSVGSGPEGALVADSKGNLYGTTSFGGQFGNGAVFELSPPTQRGKSWTEKTLYSFDAAAGDLFEPIGPLVLHNGKLYGTTYGGPSADPGGVFELSLSGSTWTETILHIFTGTLSDGWYPQYGVVFDSSGNLYGATYQGGSHEVGVIFQLVPGTGGIWTENILYSFTGLSDGGYPTGPVFMSKTGQLYGLAGWNGKNFSGLVYELKSGTPWTESVLYTFTGGTDGGGPSGPLTLDKAGNFYGVTGVGGLGNGVVFELSPSGSTWTESALYSFTGGSNGNKPFEGAIFDSTGSLYGTTSLGGSGSCSSGFGCGAVFKLTPPTGGGSWTETTLYDFTGGSDGGEPLASLILHKGFLFGTSYVGGTSNGGVVFQVKP
jgi:uncharacterized repeat protein (TIGR03803 family)